MASFSPFCRKATHLTLTFLCPQKLPSLLRVTHELTKKKQRTAKDKKRRVEAIGRFVRWVPNPVLFDTDDIQAQVTNPADLVPYISSWRYNTDLPTQNFSEERVPDSEAHLRERDWRMRERADAKRKRDLDNEQDALFGDEGRDLPSPSSDD